MSGQIRGDEQFAETGHTGKFVIIDDEPKRGDVDQIDYQFRARQGIALFDNILFHRHRTPGECEKREADAQDLEPWVFSVVMMEMGLVLAAEAPEHMVPDEEEVEGDMELEDAVDIEIE